jgi:cation-translocating P-type ATPase
MASVLPNKNEEKLLKIKQKLIEISSLSNDDVFTKFNSSKRGIIDEEIIKQNQDEFGKNEISKKGADNV